MPSAHSVQAAEIREALGSILHRLRMAAGRTLTEVAAEAGISPAYLSELERGRKDASTEVLIAVTYGLGAELPAVYAELAHELGGGGVAASWPADPRAQLRLASAALPADALRAVAQFSAFLATTGTPAPKRRIGFAVGSLR